MIVYDQASFILVVCSNSGLAENLLADIDDILASDNITSIYGQWEATKAIDSKDTKKAAYHGRSVTLVARGWSAGIRGINLKTSARTLYSVMTLKLKTTTTAPLSERSSWESLLVPSLKLSLTEDDAPSSMLGTYTQTSVSSNSLERTRIGLP